MNEQASVKKIALAAKEASTKMAATSIEDRNQALMSMAQALRSNCERILTENEKDIVTAKTDGMEEGLLDRLMLDESRIEAMASALETLISLPDPLGQSLDHRRLTNGIDLTKTSVPIGVVAMVYEARPNVTADAAGICVKTGNSVILRGGSAAQYSNAVISQVLHAAAQGAGMPENCICAIESTDRGTIDELMRLHGIIDVLIPRGGTGLIQHCVENSKVPVIETGTGNCHVYIESSADFLMARTIALNAKCRRLGVCNAAETLLVDGAIAESFLPEMMHDLAENNILMHADEQASQIAQKEGISVIAAKELDWETEYLAAEIAIKCVASAEEAIEHINRYGTKHSEAIVTEDQGIADEFCKMVDAAAVYVNVSTAFTDGGEFGMGAEIGISTQKLHARGPFALEALTSYKYVLRGEGQVRA